MHNGLDSGGHYENFPVASWVLPARFRAPVQLIYGFARAADDFADEGDVADEVRLARLREFTQELDRIEAEQPSALPLFQRLGPMIRQYQLPIGLFRDLLSAFSQDVTTKRYSDFAQLMDYCRRSANPVGRLLLHLYGETSPRSLAYSDGICTSLQLINFLQDVPIDWSKGRIYLPQDELARYGIDEQQIGASRSGESWSALMRYQTERARNMLHAGAPLGRVLKGRLGLELRMIVAGGQRILDKLRYVDGDVFRHRPLLNKGDWLFMFLRALRAHDS
jgi:squalene synthase HpnC